MTEERIDEYIDRTAVKGDTDFLVKELKTVLDLFDQINAKKITLNGATSLKDVANGADATNKAIAELKAQNEKLQKSYDDLAKKLAENKKNTDELEKAKAKLSATESDQAKEIALVNKQRFENNKQLKLQADLETASAGSIEYARAKVRELTAERNKLNITTEEGKKKQSELNTEIDQYNDFIKENVDKLARQKISIGDYPTSAKIIVDALERARQKFTDLSQAADATPAALDDARRHFESLRGVVDDKQFLNYAAAAGSAQKEVKSFTRVLIDLEQRGEGNSQAAIDLRKHLAELTDQIADVKQEVKALSSDSRSFDLFAGSVNFAVDTMQTFIGAMSLSADSEQDVQEATKTLIALQTVANGVKGIATELTTRGTAANKLYAFAQRQVEIAMDESAAAGARLRAVMATVGFGALIIGIGLLIANFDKIKRALSGVSKQQEEFNAVMNEGAKSASSEITHLKVLEKTATDISQSQATRTKAAKEMQELYPAYLKNLTQEEILNGKAAKAIDLVSAALLNRAIAQAAENKAAELGAKRLELQLQEQKLIEDYQKSVKDATKADKEALINKDKNKKEELGLEQFTTKAKSKELLKQIDDNREAQKKISKDLDFFVNQAAIRQEDIDKLKTKSTPRAKTVEFDDRELKREAEGLKALSEVQDAYLLTRINARIKAADIEKQILNRQLQTEKENIDAQIAIEKAKPEVDLSAVEALNDQKAKLQKKYNTSVRLLEEDLGDDLLKIRQTYLAHEQEQERQFNDDFKKFQEERFNSQIDAIQHEQLRRQAAEAEGQEAEIAALNKWYDKKVATTKEGSKARNRAEEKYAQDRAEIEYKYALAALKNQIDAAEKIVAARKAAGLDVIEQEKTIHELRLQLSDIETQHLLANNKKQAKSNQEKFEDTKKGIDTIRSVYQEATTFIDGMLSASIDKQKNQIQEQQDEIEKKKEAEINAINATSLSQQDKAAAIAKAEAKAAVQKEALDRKQRQLDQQKARFEKAVTIGRIIGDTAAAVVAALGAKPWTPANIAEAIAVGAIGAGQLAVALATPIPKFKDGREGGPATWGITGDGGKPEVVASPDLSQSFVTPAIDTLTYLPKNWKVFPDVDAFQEAALGMVHKPLPTMPVLTNNNDGLIHAMAFSIGRLERAVMNKQETHFHWHDGQLRKSIQNGNDWLRYIQGNI